MNYYQKIPNKCSVIFYPRDAFIFLIDVRNHYMDVFIMINHCHYLNCIRNSEASLNKSVARASGECVMNKKDTTCVVNNQANEKGFKSKTLEVLSKSIHRDNTITCIEETFLQHFLEILKRMLQNFRKILKKCKRLNKS